VREADNQLVNDAVLPDGARYRFYLNVIGPEADKMIVIETINFCPAGSLKRRFPADSLL
jgi:hypothetical protein